MQLQDYQQWLHIFYQKKGWYTLEPFIHIGFLAEETGEVARAVRALEIGRDHPDEPFSSVSEQRQQLMEELGDVFGTLAILADKYDISLETILAEHKRKLENRFNESTD